MCPRLIQKKIDNGEFLDLPGYKHPEKGWLPHQICKIPLGLYINRECKSGEIIHVMAGHLSNHCTNHTIYIGNGMHLEDEFGKYINHSFDPNVKVVNNTLVAIRDIQKYEEITYNYNDSGVNLCRTFMDEGIKVCGKKEDEL